MTHDEDLEQAYATGVKDGFKQGQIYALEQAAADVYNADPDPAFPQRQSFYNEGVSPWLEQRALAVKYGPFKKGVISE